MAFSGIAGVCLTIFVMPLLQARFGTMTLLRFLLKLYPIELLLFPLLNLVSQRSIRSDAMSGSGPALEG